MFVSACNIACRHVHEQLICYYKIAFLPAGVAVNWLAKRIYASGWFMRVEKNKCAPNTNNCVQKRFNSIWGWNPQNILELSARTQQRDVLIKYMNHFYIDISISESNVNAGSVMFGHVQVSFACVAHILWRHLPPGIFHRTEHFLRK